MIWYSDGNSGLYGVRLTNGAWPAPAARCIRKRSFLIRLPRGLRSARVTVDGRRARVLRGSRLRARVRVRGARARTVVVRIVGRSHSGERVAKTRRYRVCPS